MHKKWDDTICFCLKLVRQLVHICFYYYVDLSKDASNEVAIHGLPRIQVVQKTFSIHKFQHYTKQ
jgi:hypothetical protein